MSMDCHRSQLRHVASIKSSLWICLQHENKVSTMGDPFLNHFALFLRFFVVVVLFYAIIAINDILYKIAESRQHPHQDAIHAAGWVSLFTLHALWPFLWIWAMAYRPEHGWGFVGRHGEPGLATNPNLDELDELRRRVAELENKLRAGDR
jgi:uncharacterized protein DUF3302